MTAIATIESRSAAPAAVAAARAAAAEVAAPREYLSFCLGAEEYGIDILKVQEIPGYELPTRIAGARPSSRVW